MLKNPLTLFESVHSHASDEETTKKCDVNDATNSRIFFVLCFRMCPATDATASVASMDRWGPTEEEGFKRANVCFTTGVGLYLRYFSIIVVFFCLLRKEIIQSTHFD